MRLVYLMITVLNSSCRLMKFGQRRDAFYSPIGITEAAEIRVK